MGQRFVPFVMDSHGFMCKEAVQLIDTLASAAADRRGLNVAHVRGHYLRRMAIALQRGVARLEYDSIAQSINSFNSRVARGLAAPSRVSVVAGAVRSYASAVGSKARARRSGASN